MHKRARMRGAVVVRADLTPTLQLERQRWPAQDGNENENGFLRTGERRRRTKETRQDPSSSLKSTHQLQRSGRPCAHVGPSAITISCRVATAKKQSRCRCMYVGVVQCCCEHGGKYIKETVRHASPSGTLPSCNGVSARRHFSPEGVGGSISARLPKSLLWLTKNSWQIFRRKYSTCPHPSAVNAMNVPHVRRPCATPKTIGSRLGDLLYSYSFDFLAEQ